jgi:uncharacterized protein YcfJ
MKKLLIVLCAVAVTGCSAHSGPSHAQIMGAMGGIAGGYGGSQFGKGNGRVLATSAGTLMGGYYGQSVGQTLDRVNQMPQGYQSHHGRR